jgi:hypothetical protein
MFHPIDRMVAALFWALLIGWICRSRIIGVVVFFYILF